MVGLALWIRWRPMNVPEELRYSSDHEWVSRDGDVVRIGITDYAQDSLGDVVFVQVPEIGASLADGPQVLNEDPYGDGWICTIRMSDPSEFDALLDASAYGTLIEG